MIKQNKGLCNIFEKNAKENYKQQQNQKIRSVLKDEIGIVLLAIVLVVIRCFLCLIL